MNIPHNERIKRHSPEVFTQLLGFLKPYKKASILALIALILASTAELLMPVVMKRALDDHILRQESRLSFEAVQRAFEGTGMDGLSKEHAALLLKKSIRIGESIFATAELMSEFNKTDIARGKKEGLIDSEKWYTLGKSPKEVQEIIRMHPTLFMSSRNSDYVAIKIIDRNLLSTHELKILGSEDMSGLKHRSIQYFVLLLTVLFFTFIQVNQSSWAGQRIMADIRNNLLKHIMRQSLRYHGRTPVGSLVSRIANDVETINDFFTNVTISFLKDGAIMLGVAIVIFTLDKRLALVTMVALIPATILIILFQNHARESFRRLRRCLSSVNTCLSEKIGGMSTIQLFAAEKRSRQEFNEKNNELREAQLSQMRIMAVFRPLIDMISSVAVALVIWYSTELHTGGILTLGILVAFVELIQKFFHPVRDIADKFNLLQSAMAGGERIFTLMGTTDQIPDSPDAEQNGPDRRRRGEIRFENVHFSYTPGEPVLKGLDFHIKPGQTIGIVGASGSGKTTIANLLTRLWDPDMGRIMLDGEDLRTRPLRELRQTVQSVQQDVFLFTGTVAENISLGTGLSNDEVVSASKFSRADSMIQNLPDGYASMISENATNLSAGQRQLIAFARIIAHNPRVIILDEATASIDTQTEALIQEGLGQLLKKRTAIIIAHRLSTVKNADRILVIKNGRIIEDGNHSGLIAQNGFYKKLYRLQSNE